MTDAALDWIAQMRDRPTKFPGAHSAEAMFNFLAGFATALHDHTTADLTQYGAFIDSLYAKYGSAGDGHSWATALARHAGSDAAALDLFFEELDAFRNRTKKQNG